MAPPVKASVVYKKVDGILSITKDRQLVLFTPNVPPSSPPTLKIHTSEIRNLQQTPATKAKVSVKIVVQPPGGPAPENYVFVFSSTTAARAEAEAIMDPLKEVYANNLKSTTSASTPNAPVGSSPAASGPLAMAQVTASKTQDVLSDATLLSDFSLQKSLLDKNAQLHQRFNEAFKKLKNEADAIPLDQFSKQFWSPRIHLLRAHAMERSQTQGTYNVFSAVKPQRNNEGVVTLKLSKEQIQLIFAQHPLVRRIYDDLVPNRKKEGEFWSDFFVSRLFRKLKGEKFTASDVAAIPDLDKYLDYNEDADTGPLFAVPNIPRFLDVEGNEQDHPETYGNDDETQRPEKDQGLLRKLNTMSGKMMANVAPFDRSNLHGPVGMDEKTFDELQLKDLQGAEVDNRISLNIKETHGLFAGSSARNGQSSTVSSAAAMSDFKRQLLEPIGTPLEFNDTSKRQAASTSKGLMKSIKQRRSLLSIISDADTGLSRPTIDSAIMTHNTTIEFLHYFWDVYLSGDEGRTGELAKLVETLHKSLERIEAVATEADTELQQKQEDQRLKDQEFFKRTGKRIRAQNDASGGGKALHDLLKSTEMAVKYAETQYQRTYQEQVAQNGAQVQT
ncbi:hypothetical protein BT63DRAFT_450225 [Microthyrium microscopicum]|uniref:BSD domain-containing protein n=1 Tax=Microthyrium microscopicum TaxID=703497 RepID=A0A6A6UTU2_9PEZI|nr:hypothetical protein BT63DRAFT_450225 [Microthyrium microscopicum]